MVKTPESMAIEVVRMLHLAVQQGTVAVVTVRVNDQVSDYLNNKKRKEIMLLEESANMTVQIHGSETHFPEHLDLKYRDADGRDITLPV